MTINFHPAQLEYCVCYDVVSDKSECVALYGRWIMKSECWNDYYITLAVINVIPSFISTQNN